MLALLSFDLGFAAPAAEPPPAQAPPPATAAASPASTVLRSGITPVVPARLADTRPGASTIDSAQAGQGRQSAATSLTVDVAGRGWRA